MFEPHVVHPLTPAFKQNLDDFAAVCRVVNGMKKFTIGILGARTSKFKTVRYDEITLQKYGITCEVFDLSDLFYRVRQYADSDQKVTERIQHLKNYTDFSLVPADKALYTGKSVCRNR